MILDSEKRIGINSQLAAQIVSLHIRKSHSYSRYFFFAIHQVGKATKSSKSMMAKM